MSLMSILKSSTPKCKEVKEIIKSVAPKKADFKTYSDIPPFTNYEVLSEHKLTSSYDYVFNNADAMPQNRKNCVI